MTLNAKNDKYGCLVRRRLPGGRAMNEDDTPYCPEDVSLIGGN